MKSSRILALILALCMMLTACSDNGAETAVSATFSGGELPAGVYLYHLATAVSTASSMLEVYDDTLLDKTIDGKNAKDWIIEKAQESLRTHAAIEAKFAETGITLDKEVLDNAETTLNTFWDKYGYEMKQYGISKSSAKLVIQNNIKAELLLGELYGEGGEYEVPESDLIDYYEENYRRTILLVMSMANMSAESYAAKEKLFDEYYERAKNGEEMFDLIIEEFARTGATTIEETYKLFEGNTQEQVISRSVDFPPALIEQIFATKELDVPQQYSDDNFNIIFEVRDLMGDGFNFRYMHDTLLVNYASGDFYTNTADWAKNAGFAVNEKAMERYQPERIIEVKYS